ncbi:MAG: cytochrome P450 [Novosphingobium sp.]
MATAFELDRSIPSHVPPELVLEWPFVFGQTYKGDPYTDLVAPIHDLPPVFFARNAYPGEGAAWIVRRSAELTAIYQDNVHFSNMGFAPFAKLLGETWYNVPAEMDPPKHGRYRSMIFPLFTPKAVRALEEKVLNYARLYIGRFKEKGECEFMSEFAFEFPVKVILDLIGLPQDMTNQFMLWENDLLHGKDLDEIAVATRQVVDYLRGEIAERKRNPREDLITFGINAEVDGMRMSDDEVLGFAFNLFIGGLDTVSTNLGLQFWHLATHPEDQAYLRQNPDAIRDAIEEMLRAYAAVTTFRTCVKEIEIAGVTMKPGDKVAMSTTLAGRDPEAWPDAGHVVLSRKPQHLSFASGPHLCLGMNLARRELLVAISEFLAAIPPFQLKPGAEMEFHLGMIQPLALPLVWSR